MTIDRVVVWSNGLVAVFDENGRQMPQYQGPIASHLQRILDASPPRTRFEIGDWRSGTVPTTRDSLEALCTGLDEKIADEIANAIEEREERRQ